MMFLLLLLSCESTTDVDQQCFLGYVGDARYSADTWFECADSATSDEETQTCADELDSNASTDLETLGACAGEGCVTDWIGCITTSNDLSCYADLEECGGGWVNASMVEDCSNDANRCGNSEGCSDDYYDCLLYAAGR